MLLIYCPYCKKHLPELEFRGAGEAHIARPSDMAGISEAEFEAYFFLRDNNKGVVLERWRHVHGCGRFFNAARHSVSDKFIKTYEAGKPKPRLSKKQIEAVTPSGKATPANTPLDTGSASPETEGDH